MCAMRVAHASPTCLKRSAGRQCKAIAEEFTAAILADDRINFTFAESDVKKFTQLFYEQLCNVTVDPVSTQDVTCTRRTPSSPSTKRSSRDCGGSLHRV